MSYGMHAARQEARVTDGYMGGRPMHRVANLVIAAAEDTSAFERADLDAELEIAHDGGAEGLGNYQFLATERGQYLVSSGSTLALRRSRGSVIEVIYDAPIYDEAVDLTDTTALESLCVFIDR